MFYSAKSQDVVPVSHRSYPCAVSLPASRPRSCRYTYNPLSSSQPSSLRCSCRCLYLSSMSLIFCTPVPSHTCQGTCPSQLESPACVFCTRFASCAKRDYLSTPLASPTSRSLTHARPFWTRPGSQKFPVRLVHGAVALGFALPSRVSAQLAASSPTVSPRSPWTLFTYAGARYYVSSIYGRVPGEGLPCSVSCCSAQASHIGEYGVVVCPASWAFAVGHRYFE